MSGAIKPKLLILTGSYPCGPLDGQCGYVRDFARSLASVFTVRVLAPPDECACDDSDDTIEVYRSRSVLRRVNQFQASRDLGALLSQGWAVKFAAALSLLGFLFEALRLGRRADVICAHWMVPSGLIGALLSWLLAKPLVVVEHSGGLRLLLKAGGGTLAARFIVKRSATVIAVSDELKRLLVAACPGSEAKVEVIPMGIAREGSPARGAPPRLENGDRAVVLFLGRLTEIKGVEVLLKAVVLLSGVRVVIAGDGDRRSALERLARALAVEAEFIGRFGAATRELLLSRCDAVVIPSLVLPDGKTEGLPVVCLEAMAAGKVVVASRVGGLAEVISDGENGVLFEPGDHVALADKLRTVLKDSTLRAWLAANARATACGYDWQVIAPRFARILIEALRPNEPIIRDRSAEPRRVDG